MFVSAVGAGGSAVAATAPALLFAGRSTLYAVSLGEILGGGRFVRALRTQVVVDESTAMAHAQPDPAAKRRAFDLTGVMIYGGWNAGTLVGALAAR